MSAGLTNSSPHIITYPLSYFLNEVSVTNAYSKELPTVAVLFHWVAGIQCSQSQLLPANQDGLLDFFFSSGLNVHLHSDRELSWRPTDQCLRIELEGDSALWDQLFSSISECMTWGSPGSQAQVETALPLPPTAETAAGKPSPNPAPLGITWRKAIDVQFMVRHFVVFLRHLAGL